MPVTRAFRRFSAQGHECRRIWPFRAASLRTGPQTSITTRDHNRQSSTAAKESNPQISDGAAQVDGFHETPSMAAPSRTIVITRAKARAMGIPLSDLLGPGFTRLFHDTYVSSSRMITLRLRASIIIKRLPAATHVSHHTAVRLWGAVAPDSADIHISMASREARCRRLGVAAHLGTADAQTTISDGVPISTPVQAFLDLASVGASLVDLVIAGDSLVKANGLARSSSWRPPMHIWVAMPGVLAEPLHWYVLASTRRWRRGYAF
jgi:hypothetical protein